MERGARRLQREGRLVRIGLSYDQGTASYASYRSALEAAAERFGYGVEPVWLAGTDLPLDRAALESVDGIVLTGGADVDPRRYGFDDTENLCRFALPERDQVELPVLEEIFRRHVPTLAICRGMQFLNVFRGGSLVPDLPNHDGEDDARRHSVRIEPSSRLAFYAQRTVGLVSSSHHQAVGALGDGLRAVAWAEDGTVEAIEWSRPSEEPWIVAVQWHPERMRLTEPLAGPFYHAFLEAIDRRITSLEARVPVTPNA